MAKTVQVFILILVLHVLESALANKFSSLSLADECSLLFQFKESVSINKSASIYDSRAYPKVASWNLNGSDGAGNCCLWDGVECRLGHVIGLDLSSSFLYGPISSNNSLFNLIHLRTLNLANNDFRSSQIPSGIGRLSQLINLNLSNSFFSGKVPKQISYLGNLVSLDLTENYKLMLQGSVFQNLVQNTSKTLREVEGYVFALYFGCVYTFPSFSSFLLVFVLLKNILWSYFLIFERPSYSYIFKYTNK
ncbi:putative leucine-rich repeat-containing, plant-type, leucine-rich repeat domain superfamily [Helianthus debilis subsp. tardiflorus]